MIKLIDSRTFEEFHTDKLNHASQVALKHANGYFFKAKYANGYFFKAKYDNAFCAGAYARVAATSAFALHPELRIA